MKYSVLSIFFLYSLSIQAQTVATVYDANDQVVGQLNSPLSQTSSGGTVFTPDGLLFQVYFDTGEVIDSVSLYYENNVCQGQGYIYSKPNPFFSGLVQIRTPDEPNPLIVIDQSLEYQSRQIMGRMNEDGECIMGGGLWEVAIPPEPINPADFGLEQNPDGDWRYPAPMKVKADKVAPYSNIVFCNGFEAGGFGEIEVVTQTVEISGYHSTFRLECPDGLVPLSAGWEHLEPSATEIIVTTNRAWRGTNGESGWDFRIFATAGSVNTLDLELYCANPN